MLRRASIRRHLPAIDRKSITSSDRSRKCPRRCWLSTSPPLRYFSWLRLSHRQENQALLDLRKEVKTEDGAVVSATKKWVSLFFPLLGLCGVSFAGLQPSKRGLRSFAKRTSDSETARQSSPCRAWSVRHACCGVILCNGMIHVNPCSRLFHAHWSHHGSRCGRPTGSCRRHRGRPRPRSSSCGSRTNSWCVPLALLLMRWRVPLVDVLALPSCWCLSSSFLVFVGPS